MLDKLLKVLKKTPPVLEVKSYDKPQLSFTCPDTLPMKVVNGVGKMPSGKTIDLTVVVWTYQEDKELYWGELVNKSAEEMLLHYFPPEAK